MRSNRLSIGGREGTGVLRDSETRLNVRGTSALRRKSVGGSALGSDTNTNDRRAMLEEWRRQRDSNKEHEGSDSNKRLKLQPADAPPLPPSSRRAAASPATKRFTANATSATKNGHSSLHEIRDRIRMQDDNRELHNDRVSAIANTTISHRLTVCMDNEEEDSHSKRTPLLNRKLGVPGPARRRRGSFSVCSHSGTLASPLRTGVVNHDPDGPSLSQLTTQSEPTPGKLPSLDSVEESGYRSQIREMEQRIKQLEREKMELSMMKAPLEIRFRQKEDSWKKEQTRLLQNNDELTEYKKDADERLRDLKMKYDSILEENNKLKVTARKATSSLNAQQDNYTSVWSRRLQSDRDVADLKDRLECAEDDISALRLEKVSLEKEVNAMNIERDVLERENFELQAEYNKIAASRSENSEAEIKLKVLTTEHTATSAQLNAVCADLAATKARAEASMEALKESHKKEVAQLQFDMTVFKRRASRVGDIENSMMSNDEEDDAVLRARIEERDRRIKELESQLLKGEQERREMHNRIQELRGNIRVFVRTRPFLPEDGESQMSSIEVFPDGESLSIAASRRNNTHDFKFDHVFPPSAGQDAVFLEVSDFVQSAVDGYHVCLFSYGQTGSGKTHTMQGSGNSVMRGIIPRAVEQILLQAKQLQSQNWTFNMTASFLEIYNEELKDLLVAMSPKSQTNNQTCKLAIKRNKEGKSYVDGLTERQIDTRDSEAGMNQLDELMASAARARSVASTKMNAQSSRSHSVFMLQIHGYNDENGASVNGALNLCDLAGSERLDRSGAASDMKRLRETQSINKSLSCLGDVFNALANGAQHVPYRNSKLTYLLQDCLSGDGKALMFVNLSPTALSSSESLCSLRFAQRVNQVELGKATKHVQYSRSKRR